MKTINLIAMGQFTLDDISPFLSWLSAVPPIERSAVKMKQKPPVGSGKLTPLLRVLEQFGFIQKKQECFSITTAGEDFLRMNVFERKATIRAILLNEDEVKRVVRLLNESKTGRLPKHLANFEATSETEMIAFLVWAQSCELFGYDKKKREIFRFDRGNPKGPVEVLNQLATSPTLAKAA